MSSWSQRRKSLYSSIILIFLIGAVGIPTFLFFYKAPTCSDGIQNGGEQGVDCGGGCQKLCANAFFVPSVAWTRLQNVAPGLYNVATYIINPNPNASAHAVPYHVIVYDDQGVQITEYTGVVNMPPHRNVLAFKGAVDMGKRIPAKASFEFTKTPEWKIQVDPLAAVTVGAKKYAEDGSGASLSVPINNTSVNQIGTTDVYAVLYDQDGNALGFSKTILDSIPAYGSTLAPFTWPVSFDGKVISIEVLPVAE
ncbi:MAG: hypothetical protein PHG25_02885 [Candidatus Pacebacteria bacterium]|nr:hypothetical protein [Candidatus Paceibacterota bacterium]